MSEHTMNMNALRIWGNDLYDEPRRMTAKERARLANACNDDDGYCERRDGGEPMEY